MTTITPAATRAATSANDATSVEQAEAATLPTKSRGVVKGIIGAVVGATVAGAGAYLLARYGGGGPGSSQRLLAAVGIGAGAGAAGGGAIGVLANALGGNPTIGSVSGTDRYSVRVGTEYYHTTCTRTHTDYYTDSDGTRRSNTHTERYPCIKERGVYETRTRPGHSDLQLGGGAGPNRSFDSVAAAIDAMGDKPRQGIALVRTPDGVQARETDYSSSKVDMLDGYSIANPAVIAIVDTFGGDARLVRRGPAATDAEIAQI